MIRVEAMSVQAGAFRMGGIDLAVQRGEYFVLLGPPGSGKTVFLESLCGLKRIDVGRISIGGRDVTRCEPRERGIGYVPQDYAVFPHLTVGENIAFGLKTKKEKCADSDPVAKCAVAKCAEMLAIGHLLERSVAGLSGGERQRVALARALVLEPEVLLLDEPVSALDEATRQDVCAEIRRIQRELGITTIHVSHNLEEALSVADRAGILHGGAFQQIGTLGELMRRPRNLFTARFMRCSNIYTAVADARSGAVGTGAERAEGDTPTTRVRIGDTALILPGEHRGTVTVIIRPEYVLLARPDDPSSVAENRVPVLLVRAVDLGNTMRVDLSGPFDVTANVTHDLFARLGAEPGQELAVLLPPEKMHVIAGG
jgi:ABC-type sugar transport system ATPase subunit